MKISVMSMLLTGALALAGLTGCEQKGTPSYSHFEEIPAEGWDSLDILTFEPVPYDSIEPQHTAYDMSLVIRYASRHKIPSLPIAVTVEDFNGLISADTITIHPGSKDDKADLTTRYGVTSLRVPLASGITLTEGYNVSLESFGPRSRTKGLLNIGLIMEPTHKSRQSDKPDRQLMRAAK